MNLYYEIAILAFWIVAAVVIVAATVLVLPRWRAWSAANLTEAELNALRVVVDTFVAAADQLFKKDDPDGFIRNDWVKEQLRKAGVIIDDIVNALIEASVLKLPHGKGTTE